MKIRLNIKTLKGEDFTIFAQPDLTINDLKKQIKEAKGYQIEKQKLVYKGKVLSDVVLLSEAGVRDEDHFVLMNFIEKKPKKQQGKSTVENIQIVEKKSLSKQKNTQQKQIKIDESSLQKLIKLGYDKKLAQKVLLKNNNKLEKSIEELISIQKAEGKQLAPNEIIQNQIMKSLANNQQLLSLNQNGELKFTGDLQSLAGLLGSRNQQLQKMFLQNPGQAIQSFLQGNNDDQFDAQQQEHQHDIENEYDAQIAFTQQQQRTILRLMGLGFTREQVVPAFLACDKNQQLTANMLFNQQQNGDFYN